MCRKIPKTLSGIETREEGAKLIEMLLHLSGKYLKPYQGLKQSPFEAISLILCRKIPKTLSGIETTQNISRVTNGKAGKYLKPYQGLKQWYNFVRKTTWCDAGKYLKPYQGLKQRPPHFSWSFRPAGKYLKPYQGLKRSNRYELNLCLRRKIPKTLSGIETPCEGFARSPVFAGKYLKPYQGLKPTVLRQLLFLTKAGKYLKPYQGLKRYRNYNDRADIFGPENT